MSCRLRRRAMLACLLLVSAIVAAGASAAASPRSQGQAPPPVQAPASQADVLAQPLLVDPKVTIGTLPNGLRYYLRVNKTPERRAELRLVVNAGSILEDDDQLGLAHMVEHMAFNGTAHFAKQEIVSFMESIGMRFGPDVNASTGFDETTYMLQVPTDKPEILQRSFLILEDWAHNLTLDPVEIDKERGVIIEEWRLRRGAAARMQDAQLPILLKGSRYAERLPIGTVKSIETFTPARLKQFYTDWYRPDLMAVIAVGDFDKAAVEALVRQHFGPIPKAAAPRPRPSFDVPDHADTLFAIASDKEAPAASVAVYDKLPVREEGTVGAYRQQIAEQLYLGMLNRRFSELTQKPDPPFLAAGGGRGRFVQTKDAATLNAVVKEDGIERGLDGLFTEALRAARFGFAATELERQKRDVLRSIERAAAEQDKQESSRLAAEYVRAFTRGEPIPGIAFEQILYQRFVPEISLDEINELARGWTSATGRNRVVVASAPKKDGLAVPDGEKLAAVIKAVESKPLAAYVDTTPDRPLLDAALPGGTVVATAEKPAFGITEWTLSNGIRVVLKPTDFKQDEILFRATSPGGTSLASDADFVAAATASQVVAAGGVGGFSAIELRKVLSGKAASVRPSITETDEGLSGSASPKDLETLFQLIYLTATEPRPDPTIFGILTTQMKSVLANQKASPAFAFSEALQSALYQDHFRARPMSPELVDEMSLEKSLAFYKDRFKDMSDFTFVFVGAMDLPAMKPLVERYLGSLPSIRRAETWKDVGMRTARGVVERTVRKGIEPKSQAVLMFTGPFTFTPQERTAIRAMALVLETRLRATLREDLSGTYSVNVNANYAKVPVERYTVGISFGCAPDRTLELLKVVRSEIELLKSAGPTEQQVSDVRTTLVREFESSSKQNAYLLTQLSLRYEYGEDLAQFFGLADYYEKAVTGAMIQGAARRYLDAANNVQVTLFPEK